MSKEIYDKTLTTSFNDFGKIHLIEDAGKNLSMRFYYGPDQQRWYSVLSQDGTDVRTTIYANGYERLQKTAGHVSSITLTETLSSSRKMAS